MTDGNEWAINKRLAEREEYDRYQELLNAEKERDNLLERIEELEANLAKAEVIVRITASSEYEDRLGEAVDLSYEYLAELKGQNDE